MPNLRVERVGGLAGIGGIGAHVRSHGQLDTSSLSAVDQISLEALFKAKTSARNSQICDGFRYRISRSKGNRIETVEVAESDVPLAVLLCVKDELA